MLNATLDVVALAGIGEHPGSPLVATESGGSPAHDRWLAVCEHPHFLDRSTGHVRSADHHHANPAHRAVRTPLATAHPRRRRRVRIPTATVTATATVAPAEPTEPTEEAPPPEAPADDTLSDEGWTLTNLEVSEGALGDFEAVGRVTNETGQAAEGTIFSLSVLDADGGVIATMDASASNVDDGETVTAEFISSDPYQDGDWTYEFTVTGSS